MSVTTEEKWANFVPTAPAFFGLHPKKRLKTVVEYYLLRLLNIFSRTKESQGFEFFVLNYTFNYLLHNLIIILNYFVFRKKRKKLNIYIIFEIVIYFLIYKYVLSILFCIRLTRVNNRNLMNNFFILYNLFLY